MNLPTFIGLSLIVLSVFEAAFAVVLLRHRAGRRDPVWLPTVVLSCALAMGSMSAGVAELLAAEGHRFGALHEVTWFGWLAIPALVHLGGALRGHMDGAERAFVGVNYLFWVAVAVVALGSRRLDGGVVSVWPYVDRVGELEPAVRALGAVCLLWAGWRIDRARLRVRAARRGQLRHSMVGSVFLAVVGGVISSGLLTALGVVVDPAWWLLAGLPWLLGTIYSVSRRRLFNADRALVQVFMVMGAWALGVSLQVVLFAWLHGRAGATLALLSSQILVAGALLITPVQDRLRVAAGRVLFTRHLDHLRVITRATDAVASSLRFEQFLEFLFGLLHDNLQIDRVCLLVEDGEGVFRAVAATGYDEWIVDAVELRGGLTRWLATQRRVFVRDDERELQRKGVFDAHWDPVIALNPALLLPLFFRGRLRGVLTLGERLSGTGFSRRDLDMLETLAAYVAVALDNARLQAKAAADGLTGLPHQAQLRARLAHEVQRASASGEPLSLIMLDIDHFKRVNDLHGHQVGDRVILRVARRMRVDLRDVSLLGRYGGEEFIAILPHTSEAAAAIVAERLRVQIAEEEMVPGHPITVSLGVAALWPGASATELIEASDQALYAAKHAGRDRVVCLSDLGPRGHRLAS